MPFVKEKFIVPKKMPAFLFIMRTFNFTQGQAQRVLAKGRLLINGESIFNTGESIEGNIEIVYFKPSSKGNTPLFHNKDFMVFEKYSGVLVHPNTMATPYSLLDEIRTVSGDNANAVHRIDMETSGLLLASKHKKAESYLKMSFEDRSIKKSYLAWVDGKLTEPFSSSESIKINNDYSQTKHKVFISAEGKASHTDFVPLEYDENLDATLVACYPHTGRTHQIRVHLFHVKHPILGDPIYGTTFKTANDYLEDELSPEDRMTKMGASRLMLHAQSLTFNFGPKFHIESRSDFKGMKDLICPKDKRIFNS
ncbi:MAG: RNA pseudouridine synthase [Epsilonproteobacteria bacterium 4484_65]|nr:MAG: RNA pseudouridine synthase [Epsilonproteobacteria bacterium 4484_65]HEC45438.1 RluA family pseudouridine synthase [Campylobacterota bacterium]